MRDKPRNTGAGRKQQKVRVLPQLKRIPANSRTEARTPRIQNVTLETRSLRR